MVLRRFQFGPAEHPCCVCADTLGQLAQARNLALEHFENKSEISDYAGQTARFVEKGLPKNGCLFKLFVLVNWCVTRQFICIRLEQ